MKEIEQAFGTKFSLLNLNSNMQKSLKTLKPLHSSDISNIKNHYVILHREWCTFFKLKETSFFMYYHAPTNTVLAVDLEASEVYFTVPKTQSTFIYGDFATKDINRHIKTNLKTKHYNGLNQQNRLLLGTIIKHFLKPVMNVMSDLLGVY